MFVCVSGDQVHEQSLVWVSDCKTAVWDSDSDKDGWDGYTRSCPPGQSRHCPKGRKYQTRTHIFIMSLFFFLLHIDQNCVCPKRKPWIASVLVFCWTGNYKEWLLWNQINVKIRMSCLSVPADTRPDQTYTHTFAHAHIHTHIVRLTCSISWQITYSLDFFFFSIVNMVSHSGHQLEEIVHKHAHTNRNIQKHIHRFKNDILINKPTFLCQHFYFLFFLDRYEEWTNDDECSS